MNKGIIKSLTREPRGISLKANKSHVTRDSDNNKTKINLKDFTINSN
jgi:hypothetical protein